MHQHGVSDVNGHDEIASSGDNCNHTAFPPTPQCSSNFYEFIPEGDIESDRPRALTVGQLEDGASHYIVTTSPNGLYRYDINCYRAVGYAETSRYNLQLELTNLPVADEAVIRLGRAIDDRLAKLNIEYEQNRRSGRLHSPLVQIMAAGWSSRRIEAKQARAVRDIQFKDQLLGRPDEHDRDAEVIRELSI